MKRVLPIPVMLVALLGLSVLAANPSLGAPKVQKVTLAHLAETVVNTNPDTGQVVSTTYSFVVLEVPQPAVEAHLRHGDVLPGGALPNGTIWQGGAKGEKFQIVVPIEG